MIPLKDNIPAKHFPVVNVSLIVVNVLVFVYELKLGPDLEYFMVTFGFVPARYVLLGKVNFFDPARYLPMLTSMFLHSGFFHLLANMWMLWIFGDNVEDSMARPLSLLLSAVRSGSCCAAFLVKSCFLFADAGSERRHCRCAWRLFAAFSQGPYIDSVPHFHLLFDN